MSEYKITNWITGEDVTPPKPDPSSPTSEVIEGWNAYMRGDAVNPYPPATQEHHDWEEGWTLGEGG